MAVAPEIVEQPAGGVDVVTEVSENATTVQRNH
jgi:hypothetical protein